MEAGDGAGLPWFMDIPGEILNGVYSANEYLTRNNLTKAFWFPNADTPFKRHMNVTVVGGGNVAMGIIGISLPALSQTRSSRDLPLP